MSILICFFFFFKQKTAYELVRSDWSSDVCSSDLYLELALGPARAWVDPRLTARWEGTVYACSALLALGWLRLMHAELGVGAALPLALALTIATVGSLSVIRRAARADQLQL